MHGRKCITGLGLSGFKDSCRPQCVLSPLKARGSRYESSASAQGTMPADMLPCHDGDDPSGTVSQNKPFKTLLRSWYLTTATEKELIQEPTVVAWLANVFSSSVDYLFILLSPLLSDAF